MSDQTAIETQLRYYRDTAERYDHMHGCTEHLESLSYTVAFLRLLGAKSVLDTGCGTGFAMRHLASSLPGVRIEGNDPSADLLRVATDRYGIDAGLLHCVGSEALPFGDDAFDAVVETGVLHHVPDPDRVVDEMLRVARSAIFISDENCYGMGSLANRPVKFLLARAGLLQQANKLRRGGRAWYSTSGDGVGWTYSIFDTYQRLRALCPTVVVIPTRRTRLSDRLPLFAASHCFLAAFNQPLTAYVPETERAAAGA